MFNIKKFENLRVCILTGSIGVSQLCQMSPQELAMDEKMQKKRAESIKDWQDSRTLKKPAPTVGLFRYIPHFAFKHVSEMSFFILFFSPLLSRCGKCGSNITFFDFE